MRTYTLSEQGTGFSTTNLDYHQVYEKLGDRLPFVLPLSALAEAGSLTISLFGKPQLEIAAADTHIQWEPTVFVESWGSLFKATCTLSTDTHQISIAELTNNVEVTLVRFLRAMREITHRCASAEVEDPAGVPCPECKGFDTLGTCERCGGQGWIPRDEPKTAFYPECGDKKTRYPLDAVNVTNPPFPEDK